MGALCFKDIEEHINKEDENEIYNGRNKHVTKRRIHYPNLNVQKGKHNKATHTKRSYKLKEIESRKIQSLEIFSSLKNDSQNPQDDCKIESELPEEHASTKSKAGIIRTNEDNVTKLDKEIARLVLKSYTYIQKLTPIIEFIRLHIQSSAQKIFNSKFIV